MRKWYTVKDMYDYAVENELKLLSTYSGSFWEEYITNYLIYDKAFLRLYSSYRFFMQDIENEEETIGQVTLRFIQEVASHLLLNDKRYSELKRVNDITNAEYGLFDNIDYKKTETGSGSENGTNIYGQRQDSTSTTLGARTDTVEEQNNPFDNVDGYVNSNKTTTVKGSETDSESITKGAETDTTANITSDSRTVEVKGKDSDISKTELLKKHSAYWNNYKYYITIFNDIALELLLV